jgi:hypothetical protein
VKNEMKNKSKESTTKKLKESNIKDHSQFDNFVSEGLRIGSHIVGSKGSGKTRLLFCVAQELMKQENVRVIAFDGSETWLYAFSKIPVLSIGEHDILARDRKCTEDLEKYELQNWNLVKLALATHKDILFRLKTRKPSKRGFFIRSIINYLDELQRIEKAKNPKHTNKKAIGYFIEESQNAFSSRNSSSSELETFMTVFSEGRNNREGFFTNSQRLTDVNKSLRSKQFYCISRLNSEDITPNLRRLEKEKNLDFSKMPSRTWYYEGSIFESPEFKQHGKPYQINKALKAKIPETPEQKEERVLSLSEKILKWIDPQAFLEAQIKKLKLNEKPQKPTKGKKAVNEESLSFEELEEKELNDSLTDIERDQLEELRDLREIEEEFL